MSDTEPTELKSDSVELRPPANAPQTRPDTESSDINPVDSFLTRAPADPYATAMPRSGPDTILDTRSADAIAGYELLEPLGEGGMGIVWKARQARLNRIVALKMVLGEHRVGAKELIRFLAEAEAVASIKHPHVVQVHEYGEASGRPFLAMEYLAGGSLGDRLKDQTRLDPKTAAGLVGTIAGAVQAAHDQGIVHRDLKPGNILFDDAGEPKVTDFGIAKRVGGDELTATQAVMGTPAYMAPEQAKGNTKFVGPQADVYSLGVILYECLTGTRPFEAPNSLSLLQMVVEDEPQRPGRRVPGLPRDIELICVKCLHKEPERRYSRAFDLAEDLRRFQAGLSIRARPVGFPERAWRWCRRNPAVAGLLTAVAASLVAGLVGILHFAYRAEANADRAWKNAVDADEHAARSRDNADKLRESLLRQQIAAGSYFLEAGDRSRALWRYTRAWDLDEKGRGEESHRLRLGFTLRAGPQLVGACFHDRPVLDAAFDPTGKVVLTRTDEPRAYLWDPFAGRLIAPPLAHDAEVCAALFSPDGRTVATGSADGALRLWDARTGSLVRKIPQGSPVNFLAYSPDGSVVAVALAKGGVRFWKPDDGRPGAPDLAIPAEVYHVAFSPDGRRVVTADAGQSARVWDLATGRAVTEPLPHADQRTENEYAITYRCWPAFSPDGKVLLTVYPNLKSNAKVIAWDVDRKTSTTVADYGYFIREVRFSPDGGRIQILNGDVGVSFDAATLEEKLILPHPRETPHLAFRPDGRLMATCSTSGRVHLWDPRKGEEPRNGKETPRGEESEEGVRCADGVNSLAFSADGRLLLAASHDGTARVWRMDDGEGVHPYAYDCGHADRVVARVGEQLARFSPDGRREVRYGGGPAALLLERGDAGPGISLDHPSPVILARFSPGGRRLLTQDATATVRWWDAADGRTSAPPLELKARLHAVGFDDPGRRLMTVESGASKSAAGRVVTVWDVESGRAVVGPIRDWDSGPQHFGERELLGQITQAALSPDGRRLVLGSDATGMLGIRDVDTGKELARTPGYHGVLYSINFSADGRSFATNASDAVARVWDASTGEPLGPRLLHPRFCKKADIDPAGGRVATVTVDNVFRLWDARAGDLLGRVEARLTDPSVWFDRGGRRLVFDGGRRTLELPTYAGNRDDLPPLLRLLTGLKRDTDDNLALVDPRTFLDDPKLHRDAWLAWRRAASRPPDPTSP